MMKLSPLICVVVSLVGVGNCLDSALSRNCRTMNPGYATPPMATGMPFSITTSKDSYTANEVITVTINATGRETFKGFLIQARRADPTLDQTVPIGYFLTTEGTTPVCTRNTRSSSGNGLTHETGSEVQRHNLTLRWEAPSPARGHVQFWVSLVSDYDTYWVAEKSHILRDVTEPPLPSTTPPQYEPDVIFSSIDLEECGETKSCYRNPKGCKQDCDIIVTWQENGPDLIDFEMEALTQGWVAIGFSDDKKMGKDDVFECAWNPEAHVVEVRLSWNREDGKHNDLLTTKGLSNIETYRDDFRVSCRFTKERYMDGVFDDLPDEYHILMAKGDVKEDGTKKRHDLEPGKHPYVSKSKHAISDFVNINGTARYWLVKFHGILMVIAWMMCTLTAILLAKYYKTMWPNETLCGTDVWFAVHRGCQCVTLGCTILGFILIFIHAGGYSQMPELPDRAHPILGIIVTICCILNPLFALCRCDSKSDKRPIFNWIHWFFGTIAAVLSMPTLFIGLNLHKAFAPWWLSWVLGAFMLFHLVVELMLEIHGCINSKKQRMRDDEYESRRKGDHRGDYYSLHPDPVGTRFKKRTLAIYLCVLIICGLIIIITLAVS